MPKRKIEKLCKYLADNKAKFYAITNVDLAECTDFIKNGYLKLLAIILQQAKDITTAQLMLFKRIVAGANTEFEAEDYLRMALDIEIDDFNNFAFECKKIVLKYRLVLDAIILVGIQEKNEEQVNLIAEYCEALSVNKSEIQYLVTMGKAILEMNISQYVDAYEIKVDTIPDIIFDGYIYLIAKKCMYGNENLTIFQPSNVMDVTVDVLDRMTEISTPCVKLINVEVDLSTYPLLFENKTSVVIESCKFTGGSNNSVKFKNCASVTINNSEFIGFRTKTIDVLNVDVLTIMGCTFNNCRFTSFDFWGSQERFGRVIYAEIPESIGYFRLDSSLFNNCGRDGVSYDYNFAFICNIHANVNNCCFVDCWHKNNEGIDPDNEKDTMFTGSSKGTNNTLENSAKFN